MRFLTRLDGRTKLISTIGITLLMFSFKNYWQYLLLTGIFIIVFILGLTPKQQYQVLRHWKLILFLPALNLLVNSFFVNGKVIWVWGWFKLTNLDLQIFWRLVLLLLFALTLTVVTTPWEMASTGGKIINTLTLGTYQGSGIGLLVIIMAAFIREFSETWQTVLQAAKLRLKPQKAVRNWDFLLAPIQSIQLLQPLVLIALRKADRVADALVAQGYHQGARLFDYQKQKYHLRDFLVYLFLLLWLLVNIYGSVKWGNL